MIAKFGLVFLYAFMTSWPLKECKGQVLPENTLVRRTVCAGYFFRASCPSGAVIAVGDVQYGTKLSATCSFLNTSSGCCDYDAGDCLLPAYSNTSLQRACSGTDLCRDVSVSAVETTNCGSSYPPIYHYIMMAYYCIPVTRIASMCTSHSKKSIGSLHYLWNQDYPNAIRPSDVNCLCSVETTSCSSQIKIYSLHFQLEDGGKACSGTQRIQIDDNGNIQTLTCSNNTEYEITHIMKSSTNYITFTLQNPGGIYGGYFWVGFKATNDSALSVNCPPAPRSVCFDCIALLGPENGSLSTDSVKAGTAVIVSCHAGFILFGNNTLHCQSDGTWSSEVGSCKKDCIALLGPENGSLSTNSVKAGIAVIVSCHAGFTLFGNNTLHCQSDGTWSSEVGSCKKDCPILEAPINGYLSNSIVTSETTVSIYCSVGFTLFGDERLQCLDGSWNTSLGTCHKDCSDIISPEWGGLVYTNGTRYGSVAIYSCNNGYALLGKDISICQTDGTWSFPVPTCLIEESNGQNLSVIAGVVPAVSIVLLGAAFLLICYWKRIGKICFNKDREESRQIESTMNLKEPEFFKPISVKLDQFSYYVEKLHRNGDFLFKDGFKLLQDNSVLYPTKASETDVCKKKSRHSNLLPFDHSKVTLLPIKNEEGSDFINACHIPGFSSRWEYIATQDPLPETAVDFWRMIWEYQVAAIVMLTDKIVEGKERLGICYRYWPDNRKENLQFGEMSVKLLCVSELSNCTVRTIEIEQKTEQRVIRHIALRQWPEESLGGNSTNLLSFIKVVRENTKPSETRPIVVHCNDGVGRTGVFIAVDRLIQYVRDHDEVDVYSVILDIRKYRKWMVKSESQFMFVFDCVRDILTTDDGALETGYERLGTQTDNKNIYSTIDTQREECDTQTKNTTCCKPYENLSLNEKRKNIY